MSPRWVWVTTDSIPFWAFGTTHLRTDFSGWIGMLTAGTIWILSHGHINQPQFRCFSPSLGPFGGAKAQQGVESSGCQANCGGRAWGGSFGLWALALRWLWPRLRQPEELGEGGFFFQPGDASVLSWRLSESRDTPRIDRENIYRLHSRLSTRDGTCPLSFILCRLSFNLSSAMSSRPREIYDGNLE